MMPSRILWEKRVLGRVMLRLVQGDITDEQVDAIVNAANSALVHGGGVAGAIAGRGGIDILRESARLAPVPVGHAVVTSAGLLQARAVIHAVGPRMGEGDEDHKLANAVRSALQCASEKKFVSVSMPAISSGIFGYPKERCAEVLLGATLDFLQEHPGGSLREIRFCNFDDATCDIFLEHFVRSEPGLPLE